jgi:ABC-2 type transport system ATP-binding protein
MDAVESVRARAEQAGGTVEDIRTREPSLEDVFLDLAGREARASAGDHDATSHPETPTDSPGGGR